MQDRAHFFQRITRERNDTYKLHVGSGESGNLPHGNAGPSRGCSDKRKSERSTGHHRGCPPLFDPIQDSISCCWLHHHHDDADDHGREVRPAYISSVINGPRPSANMQRPFNTPSTNPFDLFYFYIFFPKPKRQRKYIATSSNE